MSEEDYPSLSGNLPVSQFNQTTSEEHISSMKTIKNTQDDLNALLFNQSIQRSTYAKDLDLEDNSQQIPSQFEPSSTMMTSFHQSKNQQEPVYQKPETKNYLRFNMEKSMNQKHQKHQHNDHESDHQEVYESISSDNSSEEKPKKQTEIYKPLIDVIHRESQTDQNKDFQQLIVKKLSTVSLKQNTFKENFIQKQSPVLNSRKYEVSPQKQHIFQEKSSSFELQRQNIHIIQKKPEPMFKRQQSYDAKPVISQRSSRINLQKVLENPQTKYSSTNIRSSSQQSGQMKLEAKKTSIYDAPIEFQETKDQSTSIKNLAYVSKKFTSEEPSPKRNEEFNEVYKIQAPLPKSQKKTQFIDEIKTVPQQHSNLLYISASGQVIYPSLDLGRKAKELENKNKQIQETKASSQSFGVSRQFKKEVQQKRRKASTQPEIPQRIKILQYRSEYFLKIETQVFQIEVEFPPNRKIIEMKNFKSPQKQSNEEKKSDKNYIIKRRFSDFAFLYEGIMTNQIGYIIHPFPNKSLQSFVKIKLQSLIGTALSDGSNVTQTEKVQLLERRIDELQKFVNFIIAHDELKHSEELGIFLSQDPEIYQKSRDRIQKYIQEYKELEISTNLLESGKKNIKKALESGFGMVMKWWGSEEEPVKDLNTKIEKSKQSMQMLVDTTIPQDDIEFGQYFETIGICLAKFQMLERTMLKLCEINQKFINFKDIDTQFDYLVKLCAKVSSGKEYSKNLVEMIEYDLIREIQIGRRWLEQSKGQLIKREELKELVETLKSSLTYSNDESSKISKLQRRIERFQKNFRYGFSHLIIESEKTFERSRIKFVEEWDRHGANMKKIWK